MEPVSFAVGIVGLVGLFSTCLDAVERFDSYKNFGPESRALAAQFKAQKLRLENWGNTVGLQKEGQLRENHNERLDDPRVRSTVTELLAAIKALCTLEEEAKEAPQSATENKSLREQIWPKTQGSGEVISKRQKLGWALRNKNKRSAQVERLTTLVDNVHGIVPLEPRSGAGKEGKSGQYGGVGGAGVEAGANGESLPRKLPRLP